MDLEIHQLLTKATEQQDSEALHSAYHLMKDSTVPGTTGRHLHIAPEMYVMCAEAALQLGCLEISTACLKMYFEENPLTNQLLCRAYLCQGQLKSPPATGTVKEFEEAVMCFLKVIEISKHEPRYNFMVFNASVLYFQAVRPLLRSGRCFHLVPSLRQVVQSLEEVADQDHSWRAELMMHLIECLVDSGKMEDAANFAKDTEEFINSHTPHLYPRLFTLLVQHKLSESDVLIDVSRRCTSLAVIYKIQEFKKLNEIIENELTKEDSVELEEIFHLLVDCTNVFPTPVKSSPHQSPVPAQPADRVDFLLELALLALQVKHQKVAVDCLKELKSVGETSIGQRLIMECVNCEINLLKKGAKMDDYSKTSVEARLKEIGKLDQWLQTAVRESVPQAVQAVCATQWSCCLPLLQHNLRRRIKAPLHRVVQVLEDMHSMLLEMRSHIHSELAAIEEEEGHLEASLIHLQKAMLLDNGSQNERLSSAVHLLQLRGTLYQTPSRSEDKAALLIQQARDMQSQDKTDTRPVLISVGLLLAPEDFQMVLDADNTSKRCLGSGPVAELCAQAQHHSASVQKVDGHLTRQGDDTDGAERVKLWAALVKTARRQEVWDVCRAACRFCLLYDDGRWKISKTDECRCTGDERCEQCLHGCRESQTHVRDVLRLLAEIRFINAEATVQKLLSEGAQLNSPAIPPQVAGVPVSEEDPHWVIYRDWIQALSSYASSNFLRAAELGVEIREMWVVANAAIYLWNYNNHLLAAGEYKHLVPTFQSLLEILRKTEFTQNRALVVLLCDAVARGLIQPLSGADIIEPAPPVDKGKSKAEKKVPMSASAHGVLSNPAVLQDVSKALELCDYALSNCNNPGETVPIAVRKQVLATWLQIKRLLQQQIYSKTDVKDEENEKMPAVLRVLIGVEMLQCNRNPRPMEFAAPSLSTLVSTASECSWSDAVVQLQMWCQLAAFCHHVNDHSLVLYCTKNALQLEEAAAKSLNTSSCVLYGTTAVNEMLSSAACLKGLSLIHESNGDLHIYKEAMRVLLSGVSYAEKANSPQLCIMAAKHYWNTCLPLTQIPAEKWQLQKTLEKILTALANTSTKKANKPGKVKSLLPLTTLPSGHPKHETKDEDDLTVRAAIYTFLLHLHIERKDWKSALQLLDKAVREIPRSRHRVNLLKQHILVKVLSGESILTDMQKLQDEDEQGFSFMWHQVALCAGSITQQLTSYQKSITSVLCADTPWQKVSRLLEFGEWLYCHNFPTADAQHQVQWAIDILLHLGPESPGGTEDESKKKDLTSQVGVQGLSCTQNLSNVREVRRLDGLIQAHTLLAVMTDRTSPEHQLNLLRAYTFVLQIWQVSLATVHEIFNDLGKSQPPQPSPSAGAKKDKDKSKTKKGKEPTPAEERPKPVVFDHTLPSTPTDWAHYICPDQARHIFGTNRNPYAINRHSITMQTQSLFYLNLLEKELHSLSLDHLTLPVLHLAETVAHDLLDRKSLSDIYRLRIVRTCCQLGLEKHSPYQEKLPNLSSIQEQEQMCFHKMIALLLEKRDPHKTSNQKAKMDVNAGSGQQNMDVCVQDIWLDKAEVCLSMGLYQAARQILAQAHLMLTELGDQKAMARCLLSLATLACEEQNHSQAWILLDKAQTLGGDEEFWYHFTLAKVRAVVGQGHQDIHTKLDQVIKQGCEALKLVLEQQVNRVSKLSFLVISLEMRGAVECIGTIGRGKPGETLCTKAVQRLKAACDTLRDCASAFTRLSYREQAAEAHVESAHGLRILANNTADADKKRSFLLCGFSQMQLAVALQEDVVLNAQNLLPSQEESHGLSLAAKRTLLRMRLALAEFSLLMLEEYCTEEKAQAVARARKTSLEIALEEFTCEPPEPNSTKQEWVSVGSLLGQVAVSQLAAAQSHCQVNVGTKARCLSLLGKYLRLLAVHEDPIYVCALWDRHKQKEACSDPNGVSVEKENSEKEKHRESSRTKTRMASAKHVEMQHRRHKAQQFLAQAGKALAEAVSLCLQHNLPSSVLADACLNMVECHGQSEPTVAGQYLALFQSCCTVPVIAEVLSSACADTSVSQLSALLSFRKNLLLSQEKRPTSMLKGVEDSLNSLSKAFSHLTINPNHLNILEEVPTHLKILLLQHSEDGSELYGAFYEITNVSENPKGKSTQGTLTCSSVAKVPVCPRALLALREQARAFGQESGHAVLKDPSVVQQRNVAEQKLAHHFGEIVHDMDEYLKPLLAQFDFSCLRLQTTSVLDMTKTKEKEVKRNSAKVKSPDEPGKYVVLLADRKLLELPLESLSLMQDEGLCSVSRDFSLQLLHSRLNREDPDRAERDNKKETKGGRGTKGKEDQSPAIKAVPPGRVLPSHTLPVNSRHIKYIVDPYNEGIFEETTLSRRMKEILETHSQRFSHLWEGFTGGKQTPSLAEMEQLLCRSSALIYLGMERFVANIPPAKLAALNLSDCRMALLFDHVQNSASMLRRSDLDVDKSRKQRVAIFICALPKTKTAESKLKNGQFAMEEPLETALLLSVTGVSCVALNQWRSSLQQNTCNMATVLDHLLSLSQTSGQSVHALRKEKPHDSGSHDPELLTESEEHGVDHKMTYLAFNCILYGLPNLIVT